VRGRSKLGEYLGHRELARSGPRYHYHRRSRGKCRP